MSIRLMAAVFDGDLPSVEKLVLLALADHADDVGRNCYPSIKRIALKTSMTSRGVIKVLNRLKSMGKIRAIGRRQNGTVEYAIALGTGERSSPEQGSEGTMFREGVNHGARGGEHGSPESSRTTIEPPKSKKRRLPEGFELDADMIQFAIDRGIDSQEKFAAFQDYHRQNGSVFEDWKAAWRTWVRKAVEFNRGTKPTTKGVSRVANRAEDQTRNNLSAAGLQ